MFNTDPNRMMMFNATIYNVSYIISTQIDTKKSCINIFLSSGDCHTFKDYKNREELIAEYKQLCVLLGFNQEKINELNFKN